MNNIINVNALRAALESGMSSETLHSWLDDSIQAMGYMNKHYPIDGYVAVSRKNIKEVQDRLDDLKFKLLIKSCYLF